MKLRLKAKLGVGGFGDVWRARDELGRDVAVKIVRPSLAMVSSALEHARALVRAKHRNVVSVLSLEKIRDPRSGGNVDCIVMELLDGVTLTKRLSGPKFSASEAKAVGKAIANGIMHIHKQGLEHGDLHSDNVMVIGNSAKVIDILYRDSLAILSTASREVRLKHDRTNLRLLLQQVILHSELGAAEATKFNNLLEDSCSTTEIRDAFLQVANPASLSDTALMLENAYSRVIDGGFAEGEAYASALVDETPAVVILPLLRKIVDERIYEHKHQAYFRALWARLPKPQRQGLLSDLGAALDTQRPKGEWWPLLKMVCALRKEGWDGLSNRVRLRLETLITKDVLAGYVNIHQVVALSSSGSLGTYARQLWQYFSRPEALTENIISLLNQNWFTQNYVGKFFLPVLPRLSEATGKTEEMIGALAAAVRNDAKIVVNSLEKLPAEWVTRIRGDD